MKIIDQISRNLGLGGLIEPPRLVSGGFLHRLSTMHTPCGQFAVKLLNPSIMARPTAMANYRQAEALEAQLEATGISILPALTFSGRKMQELDGQYFYVFKWFDGRALGSDEITAEHCRIIGEQLARIHAIERREEHHPPEVIDIDWDFYIDRLKGVNDALAGLLAEHRAMLYEIQSLANAAAEKMQSVVAICHGDMDCKNVLWKDGQCKIIDLECLGWSNPYTELYETALCWSGLDACRIDPTLFREFTSAYSQAGGILSGDWTVVHDANSGRIGWLEYNLKRALGIDCAPEERTTGISESTKTLHQLAYCRAFRNTL